MVVAWSEAAALGQRQHQEASALASYRAAIRPAEATIMALYAEWNLRLTRLLDEIENVGLERSLIQTGATGIFFKVTFGACQRQVAAVQPPPEAARHHQLWLEWIGHMTRASEVLAGAARWSDASELGRCREILVAAHRVVRVLGPEEIRIESGMTGETRPAG